MSAVSKLGALALTYPYQVVRSRVQVGLDHDLLISFFHSSCCSLVSYLFFFFFFFFELFCQPPGRTVPEALSGLYTSFTHLPHLNFSLTSMIGPSVHRPFSSPSAPVSGSFGLVSIFMSASDPSVHSYIYFLFLPLVELCSRLPSAPGSAVLRCGRSTVFVGLFGSAHEDFTIRHLFSHSHDPAFFSSYVFYCTPTSILLPSFYSSSLYNLVSHLNHER
jgi:hypothetical protein